MKLTHIRLAVPTGRAWRSIPVGVLLACLALTGVLRASQPAPATEQAASLARLLGLPGDAASAVGSIATTGQRLEAVELRDPRGRVATVITRDPASGALRSAVRLAWEPALDAPGLTASDAVERARRVVETAGLRLSAGSPLYRATWDPGMDAWLVRFPRTVMGVPVHDDGIVVWIHRGGALKALSVFTSQLAAPPRFRVAPEIALRTADAFLERSRIARMRGLVVERPTLEWVTPNGFADATVANGPTPPLRLAWVVRLSYVPPGWDGTHLVELYVDAGSGVLIGGTETA